MRPATLRSSQIKKIADTATNVRSTTAMRMACKTSQMGESKKSCTVENPSRQWQTGWATRATGVTLWRRECLGKHGEAWQGRMCYMNGTQARERSPRTGVRRLGPQNHRLPL